MSKNDSSPEPKRFDFEAERKKIAAAQPPEPGEGVHWDKPSPTDNPTIAPRAIPKHLLKIVDFFQGIILDESLVLDLCLERCMEIIQQNVLKKTVGIDQFQEFGPMQYAAVAGPMTVELYKQVLSSIGERADEYQKLVQAAKAERERAATPPASRIIVPE
jgi:hypothetical protein